MHIFYFNPFPRISNSFPRITNSFPRITNSWERIGNSRERIKIKYVHVPYGLPYHPLTLTENFMKVVPGGPLRRGVKPKRGKKYTDFGPIEDYISETAQDTR